MRRTPRTWRKYGESGQFREPARLRGGHDWARVGTPSGGRWPGRAGRLGGTPPPCCAGVARPSLRRGSDDYSHATRMARPGSAARPAWQRWSGSCAVVTTVPPRLAGPAPASGPGRYPAATRGGQEMPAATRDGRREQAAASLAARRLERPAPDRVALRPGGSRVRRGVLADTASGHPRARHPACASRDAVEDRGRGAR
jgi:hypothetical protein